MTVTESVCSLFSFLKNEHRNLELTQFYNISTTSGDFLNISTSSPNSIRLLAWLPGSVSASAVGCECTARLEPGKPNTPLPPPVQCQRGLDPSHRYLDVSRTKPDVSELKPARLWFVRDLTLKLGPFSCLLGLRDGETIGRTQMFSEKHLDCVMSSGDRGKNVDIGPE